MIRDATTIARRNIIRIGRVPEVMVFVIIQPLMFVLLFAYVFGGSIDIPGGNYREFLIAGIFAQTVVFGSTFTASGLAGDVQKGLINRFRSLPMSRSAVVAGRTASDVVVAYLLLLFFAYSFSWVMACLGLLVPSQEVVDNATFIVLFPLTFIANTFVPSESLPGVLKTVAEWNPVSTLTHAVRVRFGNLPAGTPEPSAWPLQNAMLYSLGWAILLIVIFAPIATRLYQRAEKR